MAKIDISKTADLAKLSFTEKEAELTKNRLEKIIEYVGLLDELDCGSDFEYNAGFCELREDTAVKYEDVHRITEAAPKTDGEYIEVPRVVEKGDGL